MHVCERRFVEFEIGALLRQYSRRLEAVTSESHVGPPIPSRRSSSFRLACSALDKDVGLNRVTLQDSICEESESWQSPEEMRRLAFEHEVKPMTNALEHLVMPILPPPRSMHRPISKDWAPDSCGLWQTRSETKVQRVALPNQSMLGFEPVRIFLELTHVQSRPSVPFPTLSSHPNRAPSHKVSRQPPL